MFKKALVFFSLAIALPVAIEAQAFEGSIEFKHYTSKDTTLNTWFVKGNKVLLSQNGKVTHLPEEGFIFDLNNNKIVGLNHIRKVYENVNISKSAALNKIDTVIKLKDTKTILGYKCTGYLVKSKGDNAQITFWLANGHFDFFSTCVELWNRKDKPNVYIRQIKDLAGCFPMLSIESDMNGKEVGRLEAIKITPKIVDPAMLVIPKDYLKFE